MIHARPDYNRFQDPGIENPVLLEGHSPIGLDEPVMLFRAKDKFFINILQTYYTLLSEEGKHDMAELVFNHIGLTCKWQEENGTKTPDL